jgi:hypothetical protein
MPSETGTYTAGVPEDVKSLRAKLIAQIKSGLSNGATPYTGPMGTTADSGQLAAMNMLMGMSGNGAYKTPSLYGMGGTGSGGGNNGSGAGGGATNGRIPVTPNIPAPNPTDYRTTGSHGALPPWNPDYGNPFPGGTGNGVGNNPKTYPVIPPGDYGGGGVSTPLSNTTASTADPQMLFQLISAMRGMR